MKMRTCPFCGGDGYVTEVRSNNGNTRKYVVYCLGCKVRIMKQFASKHEAVEAWNRRNG